MRGKLFPLSNVMVCTKLPIGLRRRTAASGCAGGRTRQLGDFGQLGFTLDQHEQAAFVTGADDGVALPQSTRRIYARQTLDARKCAILSGITPRPARMPARLL